MRVKVWDTLAIAEYLNEMFPQARMLPADRSGAAHCRSISGEMHSGFAALAASLPMNLKLFRPDSRSGRRCRRISSASPRSGASACQT